MSSITPIDHLGRHACFMGKLEYLIGTNVVIKHHLEYTARKMVSFLDQRIRNAPARLA